MAGAPISECRRRGKNPCDMDLLEVLTKGLLVPKVRFYTLSKHTLLLDKIPHGSNRHHSSLAHRGM